MHVCLGGCDSVKSTASSFGLSLGGYRLAKKNTKGRTCLYDFGIDH